MVKVLATLVCLLGAPKAAQASSLPGSLSPADVNRATQLLVIGGTTRLMRSAESYPGWPGIKIGIEIDLLPGSSIGSLGNQQGSVGAVLPSPKIYLAKGLSHDFEAIFTIFPAALNTVAGAGLLAKWTLITEKERWFSLASYAGLTGVDAFQGELQGAVIEMGAVVSKDYVRIRPYFGAGILFAKGTVNSSLATSSVNSGTMMDTHLFLGSEFELPVTLTAQIDLFNLDPAFAAFVGRRF